MARLLPDDFDLHDIAVPAERGVVQKLLDRLDESWVVIPNVRVKIGNEDSEIDIAVASPDRGLVIIEVKGGIISIRDGQWFQYDVRMNRSPDEQIMKAKHALVKRLKAMGFSIPSIVDVVSLPDVRNTPDIGIGPGLPLERVLDGNVLDDPVDFFAALIRDHSPTKIDRFEAFLQALVPTIELDGRVGRASPAAMRLLDEATTERLDVLRALGDQRRVLVTGGPGTGKTWLLLDWARRAAARGDRAAVICFNRPIADRLAAILADESILVTTYHGLIMDHLIPDHGLQVPEGARSDYWDVAPTELLIERMDTIAERFDTFIVDEGQDLRPLWLDTLEQLLDPQGPQRILMTADTRQTIYIEEHEWRPPEGAQELPLEINLRSTRSVASVISNLGGPRPLDRAPAGLKTAFLKAGGAKEVVKRVRRRIDELVHDFGVPHSEIIVLTTRTTLRDAIRESSNDDLQLVAWEQRDEGVVACETVHRTKGLEATAVILATLDDPIDDQLVYVGASRAIWSLTIVGREEFAALCGVDA
jgi:hypothetical protein